MEKHKSDTFGAEFVYRTFDTKPIKGQKGITFYSDPVRNRLNGGCGELRGDKLLVYYEGVSDAESLTLIDLIHSVNMAGDSEEELLKKIDAVIPATKKQKITQLNYVI